MATLTDFINVFEGTTKEGWWVDPWPIYERTVDVEDSNKTTLDFKCPHLKSDRAIQYYRANISGDNSNEEVELHKGSIGTFSTSAPFELVHRFKKITEMKRDQRVTGYVFEFKNDVTYFGDNGGQETVTLGCTVSIDKDGYKYSCDMSAFPEEDIDIGLSNAVADALYNGLLLYQREAQNSKECRKQKS